MRIRFPWEKPERRILIWRNPPGTAVLRKAQPPRPRSAFLRLVDTLAAPNGRVRFRSLWWEIANGARVRRAPRRRIVGISQ